MNEASRKLIEALEKQRGETSHTAFAALMGLKYNTWRRVKNGTRPISVDLLAGAVQAFPDLEQTVAEFLRNWQVREDDTI